MMFFTHDASLRHSRLKLTGKMLLSAGHFSFFWVFFILLSCCPFRGGVTEQLVSDSCYRV